MRRLLFVLSVAVPVVVFADPPAIPPPTSVIAPFTPPPASLYLPTFIPSFSLPPASAPILSAPHTLHPYVTPIPAGRPVSSVDTLRMTALAAQQGRITRYLDSVLTPLNRYLNTPLVGGAPSTSRVFAAPNPADFELVFERRRAPDSVSMETLIRRGSDSLIDRKFLTSAASSDAGNLARLYADSIATDPARMTDKQKADMAQFVTQFKTLQVAYRAAWEKSIEGKSPLPDPGKPWQQALFALNRILNDAYANTKPGSDERAGVTAFLMRVAQDAPIDSFISTYLVPKTFMEQVTEMAEKGEVAIVDASGPDGADNIVDALKDLLAKKKEPDPARSDWNIASTLGFYNLELRYFPSASVRPGRDVQVVIIAGPRAGRYMWLQDYIRAGYPRNF